MHKGAFARMLLRFSCLSDNHIFLITTFENQKKAPDDFLAQEIRNTREIFVTRVISFDQLVTIDECSDTLISVDCILKWKMYDAPKISEPPENEPGFVAVEGMNFINSMLRRMRPTFLSVVNICESRAAKRVSKRGKIAVVW